MKKFICLILSLVCICSLFIACSSEKTGSSSNRDETDSSNAENESSESNNIAGTDSLSDDGNIEETPALEDIFEWQNVDGGIEITKYKGSSKIIEVPEIIDNKKVVSVGTAFEGNVVVETLILPKYVKRIDLSDCDSLKRVEWAAERIGGDGIFPSCIEEIILPNLNIFSFSDIECYESHEINIKLLDIPSAYYISALPSYYDANVNIDEVVISQLIDYAHYEKGAVDFVGNAESADVVDTDYGDVYLDDTNREEVYKDLFGENVKVTVK